MASILVRARARDNWAMPFRWTPLVCAALLLAACSLAMDWREVRPESSGAALMLPCKPASHARNVMLAGASARLTLYACTAGGVTWALAHADVKDPALVGVALRELRATAAANLGAGPEAPIAWRIAGATPNPDSGRFELGGRLPDGQPVREQLAVYAHGTTVFQATALGERLDAESLEVFFAGLRLPP
jgi:hypothetical protein